LHPSTLAKRVHFLLLLLFLAFYFYGLGQLPLLGPDEPRYAQVAREMFLRGDWITPTLGGYTWFEKPALLYWMQIAAFRMFGVHEYSARLGPAICGLLTIGAIWQLARKVESKSGQYRFAEHAALVSASCLGLITFSRGGSFDIVVTMTTAWALSCFVQSELAENERKEKLLLAGFYCFVGLSLLAKGLVGIVIPGGVITAYYLLRREWPNRRVLLSLLWGGPLALLISSVWYGPVIYKHGWKFINEFFIQHHFARYLSNKYHHPQPIYFYPIVLLMLSLPWTPFLVDALIKATNWKWQGRDELNRLFVFSFAWLLFPIVFFSFSGSKLPGYILPVLPPALILISYRVRDIAVGEGSRWPLVVNGALLLCIGIGGLVYGLKVAHLSVLCAGLVAFPFVVAGGLSAISRSANLAITSTALSVLVVIVVLLNCAALTLVRRESTRDLLRMADARGYSSLRVLAMPSDDRTPQFYANGRVIYGANGEVQAVHDVPQIVNAARQRNEKLLAFIPIQDLRFYQSKPGVEVIGDNGKFVLICLY